MNRVLLLLLIFACSTYAEDASLTRGVYEFQNDDVSLVLRVLARHGDIKLVITSKLSGTVSLRTDGKTARETFDLV